MDSTNEKLELFVNLDVERDYNGDQVLEVAKIVDVNCSKDVLYLFYDKNCFPKTEYHLCAGLFNEDGIPCIMIDDEHRATLYDKPDILFAMLLHELGHYRNGDLDSELNNSENIKERSDSIRSGKAQEKELKADAFAVKHIGKNKMLRAIDYLIKKRKERKIDPIREEAIREFELRKKAIQRIKY